MKQFRGFILVMLCALFMGITHVNASTTIDYHNGMVCSGAIPEADGRVSETCEVGFDVSGSESALNEMHASLTLINVTLGSITPATDWYLTSSTATTFALQTSASRLTLGRHVIATIKFYKIDAAKDCSVTYNYSFTTINRACTVYQNHYYDLLGNITDSLTYSKECEKHYCETLSDGTKYGKDGTEVTDITYSKECEKHYCETLSDGTKYGKDGTEVTDITYSKECEKHYCETLSDGTKYGKDGTEVNDLTYSKECEKNYCKVLSDGTKYGKDGTEVTDLEYTKECEVNICKILSDGTIYGKEGKEVDQATYDKECKSETKYYCTTNNGKYYDKDGNETSEENYNITCVKHYCEVIGSTYFDSVGNQVSKSVYNASCTKQETIENPKTGSTVSYAFISLGIVGSSIGLLVLRKKNKIYHL